MNPRVHRPPSSYVAPHHTIQTNIAYYTARQTLAPPRSSHHRPAPLATGGSNSPNGSPGPAASPHSASPVSVWQFERVRRLKASRSVMGSKLSRREAHESKKQALAKDNKSPKADSQANGHSRERDEHADRSHRSAQVVLPNPMPNANGLQSPVSTSRTVAGDVSCASHASSHVSTASNTSHTGSFSSNRTADVLSPPVSPLQLGVLAQASAVAAASVSAASTSSHRHHHHSRSSSLSPVIPSAVNHAAPLHPPPQRRSSSAHSTVPAAAAASPPMTQRNSRPISPALSTPQSPITSASPFARRIKPHYTSNGSNGPHNYYALPSSIVNSPSPVFTTSPVQPLSSPLPAPMSPLALATPAPSSHKPDGNHASVSGQVTAAMSDAQTQHEEAILFSPAYVLPVEGAPTTVPPSVNSIAETVAAQSSVVQAVAAGHAKPAALAAGQQAAAELDGFDPFLFIKNLPPRAHAVRTCKTPVLPPLAAGMLTIHAASPRISLVLDLDETLVHCSVEPLARYDLTFPVIFASQEYKVYVRLRPHLFEFLRTVSQWFEVIVFTASQKIYADKLLTILEDRARQQTSTTKPHPHARLPSLFHHRIFRDSCVCVEGNYLKDLSVLGRDPARTVIVDNSVQAFGYDLDSGIPIESFFGQTVEEDCDDELLKLLPFLDHLRMQADVRPTLKQTFKLSEFVHGL